MGTFELILGIKGALGGKGCVETGASDLQLTGESGPRKQYSQSPQLGAVP